MRKGRDAGTYPEDDVEGEEEELYARVTCKPARAHSKAPPPAPSIAPP